MREMDRRTIDEFGISGVTLMENAGRIVTEVIQSKIPDLKKIRVNIFAGKGNNGGDGFVVARHLYNLGSEPTVFLVAEKEDVKGDAKANMDTFIRMGGRVKEFTTQKHIHNFKLKFFHTTVVVDALLGTGISSAPRGFYNDVLKVMNGQGKLKVAVDIPSGLTADSGVIPGSHFNADITVTFGSPKVGLVTSPARNAVGELVIADISIPPVVVDESPSAASLLEGGDIAQRLPKRSADAHKGAFGHLALACGSPGMGGAVAFAGMGALRMGAGLVTAAVPESIALAFEVGTPEMMTVPLCTTDSGAISSDAADSFLKFAKDKTGAIIGPGLRQDPSTKSFTRRVIQELEIPLVIDADGLNHVGHDSDMIKNRNAPTIVTPHPGEMGRLTGKTVGEVQEDRIGCAAEYSKKTGAVVVLKGAGTIIAGQEGEVFVCTTGNHGLAAGGTGDVLSGMIAGLLVQGAAPLEAAIASVFIHGRAADIFAENNDPRSLVATDLLNLLPVTLRNFA